MFEQSFVIENRTNKPWGFFASMSFELAALSLAILIPLAYTDHLPDFHLKTIAVTAPPRPMEPVPVSSHSSPNIASPLSIRRIFTEYIPRVSNQTTATSSSSASLDVPPGLPLETGGGVGYLIPQLPGPTIAAKPPAEVKTPAKAPAPNGPIRVSVGVQMARLVKQVIPVYPALAKTARISGVVHLVGIISRDGTIRNLQLISGHPMLAQAALDAVRQWVYRPTLLSGEPVEVIAPIDVQFTLNQ